jgi:nitroimidazol reductase NimA-like FMN-containing flavoprotein (pyridoxamine 5'-phosphate oxidase superfamily)
MTIESLLEHGLERMTADAVDDFLRAQNVGILGLPDRPTPYLLPLAYGYDGENRLFFTFFVEGSSRKVTRSERADAASFLVYRADSAFIWESVLLEGTVAELPETEWDAHEADISSAWRLDLFERAESAGDIRIFTLDITDRTGVKYTELPPGFAGSDGGSDR